MSPDPRTAVVLLAAGAGRRVGAETNKVLLPLAGLPVFAWSLRTVAELEYVDQAVVVVRDQDRDLVTTTVREQLPTLPVQVVSGGDTRHGSEWHALQALAPAIDSGRVDVVAVHDTARPLAGADLFRAVVAAAAEHGGALPVRAQSHLARRSTPAGSPHPPETPATPSAIPPTTPATSTLAAVQTPQAFRAAPLLAAYRAADRDGFLGTDTASCVAEYTDLQVVGIPSPATNLKITFPEDVALAEQLLVRLGRR